jgi:hypothetical protein
MAWVGVSPNYPQYTAVTLDLGKEFAGKTVKVRFRVGADEGTGAEGWDVDDVVFGRVGAPSLSNTPFGSVRENAGVCGAVPPMVPTGGR